MENVEEGGSRLSMTKTAGQTLAAEVTALLKARNALIVVVSPEEGRVERSLIEAAAAAKYDRVYLWDCDNGITDVTGAPTQGGREASDPGAVLSAIRESNMRALWILRDLCKFGDPNTLRRLRNLARALPTAPVASARAIILLQATSEVSPDLSDHATVVKWTLPDRTEIGAVFDKMLSGVPDTIRDEVLASNVREAAIEAAVGLSAEAAASCFSKSLVTQRKIIPAVIAGEKKRVVSGKGIEWFDADPRGLDAVGGLEYLKPWLLSRKAGFTQEARDFGLPSPKGIVLVGVSGCGKSLTAKATAAAFECPLLRLDGGATQSKWVGESQANIRAAFAVADNVGRCVLWLDEAEKMFAGATQGAADGGVSSDMLGVFLTWMQERKSDVFVMATSNDVSKMPPELLRKGRWDDLFFVDLPTRRERIAIVKVALKKYGRADADVNAAVVADATEGFSGAEIDALIPDVLFVTFADGKRAILTADLVKAATETVPLSRTAPEKIKALRDWAKGRARPASLPENASDMNGDRNLDL